MLIISSNIIMILFSGKNQIEIAGAVIEGLTGGCGLMDLFLFLISISCKLQIKILRGEKN